SAAATFTITVTPGNDPPTANPASVSVPEDGIATLTLTGSDRDGDPLTFAVTSPPANGTLAGTAPNLTYQPNPNFNGPDSFQFTANDGSLTSAAATFTLTVTSENDGPTISDISDRTVNEDSDTGPLSFTVGDEET